MDTGRQKDPKYEWFSREIPLQSFFSNAIPWNRDDAKDPKCIYTRDLVHHLVARDDTVPQRSFIAYLVVTFCSQHVCVYELMSGTEINVSF